MASVLLAGDGFGFMMFLVIGAGVVGLIIWSVVHQKKVRENWLQVQGATNRPVIQGWLGQVYVTLNTVVRGSGKNRSTYTQYHVGINAPMPQGLSLTKEGFFSKVGKVFGGQDVQIGDRAIDDAFIIKAGDMLGAHNLLSLPPVKKALLYTIARHPGLRVSDRNILVEHNGMTGDLRKIEGVFEDLTYLALTLDAGYQELAGGRAMPQGVQKTKPAPAPRQSSSSRSAPAEILAQSTYVMGNAATTRQASAEEIPAQRAFQPQAQPVTEKHSEALSSMASALDQYAKKLESGEATPQRSTPINMEDAFASQDNSTAFENANLNDAVESFQSRHDRDTGITECRRVQRDVRHRLAFGRWTQLAQQANEVGYALPRQQATEHDDHVGMRLGNLHDALESAFTHAPAHQQAILGQRDGRFRVVGNRIEHRHLLGLRDDEIAGCILEPVCNLGLRGIVADRHAQATCPHHGETSDNPVDGIGQPQRNRSAVAQTMRLELRRQIACFGFQIGVSDRAIRVGIGDLARKALRLPLEKLADRRDKICADHVFLPQARSAG